MEPINIKSLTTHFFSKYSTLIQQLGWDKDDLYQEIYMILDAKDLLDREVSHNLAITVVKNAIIDKSRKQVRRWKSPCLECPLWASARRGKKCLRFSSKDKCEVYSEFAGREMNRPNIANCMLFSQCESIEKVGTYSGLNLEDADTYRAVWELCMEHLEGPNRALFLAWEAGDEINSNTFGRLITIIRGLIARYKPDLLAAD